MDNKIVAGIVTYNPDITRLLENVQAIYKQVVEVYIFDNGSENISDIYKTCGSCARIISSQTNKGIAYALNRLFETAEKEKIDWVLTLDQDSICYPHIIESYKKYLNVADSITSARKEHNVIIDGINTDFIEVDRCITSGNLVRVSKWRRIQGFNERLFIDMVDVDFCFRLTKSGGKIIRVGIVGILHEMGDGTRINLFGKSVYIGNYSAFRKYYIARNMIYVIRKYKLRGDHYSYKRILLLFFHAIFREKNKTKRSLCMVKGVIDGFRKYKYIDKYFESIQSKTSR